jgi:hypothetical protein
MKYRLLKKTDEWGTPNYFIERALYGAPNQQIGWSTVFASVDEKIARDKFASIKAIEDEVLDFIEIKRPVEIEPDEPEQPAASPS